MPSGLIPSTTGKKSQLPFTVESAVGALFALVLLIEVISWKRRRIDDEEKVYLDQVLGMPTRFSYEA